MILHTSTHWKGTVTSPVISLPQGYGVTDCLLRTASLKMAPKQDGRVQFQNGRKHIQNEIKYLNIEFRCSKENNELTWNVSLPSFCRPSSVCFKSYISGRFVPLRPAPCVTLWSCFRTAQEKYGQTNEKSPLIKVRLFIPYAVHVPECACSHSGAVYIGQVKSCNLISSF